MPAKKQTKKLTPSKLIKTNGKFSWKKATLIVVILAALGTILVRLSYAATPSICNYAGSASCETYHDYGRLDSRVWPNAWYGGKDNTPNVPGKRLWSTTFTKQGGSTTAPSGIAYHHCIQLEANSGEPNLESLVIWGNAFDGNGAYKDSNLNGRFSVNGLRWLMKNKVYGSSLQAESTNGVRGVVCGDIKGGSGTWRAPTVYVQNLYSGWNNSLLVDFMTMQRL